VHGASADVWGGREGEVLPFGRAVLGKPVLSRAARLCGGVRQAQVSPGVSPQLGAVGAALQTVWTRRHPQPFMLFVFCTQNLSQAGKFFLNSLIPMPGGTC